MIFFKPAWINHEGSKPIFSVDIHPKGNRFATGGQGGSGGRIVIWNINPILNEKDEEDEKVPKMLCQMDNHLACVNVVRWSNMGHYLASGSDDKLVMIWRLTNEGSSTIFGSGKVNVETWKCVHTLNSHNGDVLDLAWAPHDGWLASGSVDNTVIIWNAHKFPEKIAVLKNHTGMVKGVTWDPVGKYIASQSDDKSLRIWRTSDWTQQELVKDPFQECSATTHVLRCSWSPDGQYLVSAHAMNGGGPTAQIIEREGWKQDKDFVGHRKAVTCVRFNQNIFKKLNPESPKKATQYCCAAIGSRDRSISVWLTSLKRPLVVIKDLFDDSVLDITWSSDGLYLLACSWDGSVACVSFMQNEIGTPLTMEEKVEKMALRLPTQSCPSRILDVSHSSRYGARALPTVYHDHHGLLDAGSPYFAYKILHRELIGRNDLYEQVYHKSLQKSWNMNLSGTQIVEDPELLCAIEEMNEKNSKEMEVDPPPQLIQNPPKHQEVSLECPKSNTTVHIPHNKQVETRLPSGKRRITPMHLTSVQSINCDSNSNTLPVTSDATTFSKSSPSKSQIVVETRTVETVKKVAIPNEESKNIAQSSSLQTEKSVTKPPGTQITYLMCTEVPGDEPVTRFINILDPVKFPTGVAVTKHAVGTTLIIQVTNNCHRLSSNSSLSKIEVCKGKDEKEPIWETYLGSPVRLIASNRKLVVACAEDLTINCYCLKSGARPLPPLLIEDLVSSLTLSDKGNLLVLTKTGLMHMWHLYTRKSVLNRVSVRSLLSGSKASVTGCFLTSSDQPILTLSDGRAYSYSMDLKTWVQLSNPLDPVSRSGASMTRKIPSHLPLASLQRLMPANRSADAALPSSVTLSFLESQITATGVLESVTEYKHWLFTAVNHLLDKGPECRLKVILDDLMGPTHGSTRKDGQDAQIMGLSKRSLLEEILSIIKTKLPWQRLYREYTEQLKDLE